MQPVQFTPDFRGYDMVAVAKLAHALCRGCGHGNCGVVLTHGKAVCRNCGFTCTVKAKAKPKRRAPARRPALVHNRPTSMPRPREGGARTVGGGRDGSGERDDGGGDSDGDGGGSDPPPPPRSGAHRLLACEWRAR